MLMKLARIRPHDLQKIDHTFSALDVDNEGHLNAQDVVVHNQDARHNRIQRLKQITSSGEHRKSQKHGKKHQHKHKHKNGKKHGEQKSKRGKKARQHAADEKDVTAGIEHTRPET